MEAAVPDVGGVRPVCKPVARCDLAAAIGLLPSTIPGTLELLPPFPSSSTKPSPALSTAASSSVSGAAAVCDAGVLDGVCNTAVRPHVQKQALLGDDAFVLKGVLSPAAAQRLVALTERAAENTMTVNGVQIRPNSAGEAKEQLEENEQSEQSGESRIEYTNGSMAAAPSHETEAERHPSALPPVEHAAEAASAIMASSVNSTQTATHSANNVADHATSRALDAGQGAGTLGTPTDINALGVSGGYSFWNEDEPEKRDYRNAYTLEVVDPSLAGVLWERIQPHVVPTITIAPDDDRWERGFEGTWRACGINEHLLFARYGPGGHFSPHTDGYTIVDFNHRSLFTVLVYLNDCAVGGATRLFQKSDERLFVRDAKKRFRWEDELEVGRALPRAGNVFAFYQDLPHEGEPVGEGCAKYIIRTDIMFRREPAICTSERDREAYRLFREAELLEAEGDPMGASKIYQRASRISESVGDILGF